MLVGIVGIVIQIARRRRSSIEFSVQFILVLLACFWLYYIAVPSFNAATKLSNELANAYKSEKYKVAEGYVHVLHKQPKTGHSKGDIVVVNGEAVLGIGDHQSAFIENVGDVYPNPITHNASINVSMKKGAMLRIAILNNYGQTISVNENSLSTGMHKIDLATDHLPKGIYFISVQADDGIAMVKKLVKL